jgi:hypothetical protein
MDISLVIQRLHENFPDFIIDDDDLDLPTVVFGFFSDYIKKAVNLNDDILVGKIITFLTGLLHTNNKIVESCLDEIALGLDDAKDIFIQKIELVNTGLYLRLIEPINMWEGIKINKHK